MFNNEKDNFHKDLKTQFEEWFDLQVSKIKIISISQYAEVCLKTKRKLGAEME